MFIDLNEGIVKFREDPIKSNFEQMGIILSVFKSNSRSRIHHEELNNIPIHHKCRNCGRPCQPSVNSTGCINQIFTRTGTSDQPAIIRPAIPDDKVHWWSSFRYEPIEFTAKKVLESKKEYTDRDPRLDENVRIPWNSDDKHCDRRSYHGNYKIIDHIPRNPCGRTGVTGRGHLGKIRIFSKQKS